MRSRWQHSRHRRRDEEPPPTLAVVERERPRPRLRLESDGPEPAGPRRGRRLRPLPVAAAVLVLLALVGYLSVYQQTTRRTPVLIAARALPAGTVVRASDLATAGLAGSGRVLATFLPAGEARLVVGRTVRSAVAAGAPVPAAALAPPGRGVASLTLAVPLLHALAGALQPGDRVTVLATYTNAQGGALTRVVARDLEVLAVGSASGFDAATQTIPITVALPDPSTAAALTLANETAKIDLLHEPSAGSSAPIPSASTSQGAP